MGFALLVFGALVIASLAAQARADTALMEWDERMHESMGPRSERWESRR